MGPRWVRTPIILDLGIGQWYCCVDYYVLQMQWRSRWSNLLGGERLRLRDIAQSTNSSFQIVHWFADERPRRGFVEFLASW